MDKRFCSSRRAFASAGVAFDSISPAFDSVGVAFDFILPDQGETGVALHEKKTVSDGMKTAKSSDGLKRKLRSRSHFVIGKSTSQPVTPVREWRRGASCLQFFGGGAIASYSFLLLPSPLVLGLAGIELLGAVDARGGMEPRTQQLLLCLAAALACR